MYADDDLHYDADKLEKEIRALIRCEGCRYKDSCILDRKTIEVCKEYVEDSPLGILAERFRKNEM